MQTDLLIARYLSRYGASETRSLHDMPGRFHRAVVIPVFAEPVASLLRLHEPPLCLPGTLTIIVINAPESAGPDQIQANRRYSETLSQRHHLLWRRANIRLHRTTRDAAVLAIERFEGEARLPRRAAVGLARRIGCDCALQLWLGGQLENSLIQTTDADARLPVSCFDADAGDAVALVFPFRHDEPDNPRLALAMCLYELSMHYYVLGLRWAGSPYAMHTIGSTLAVCAAAYARVRGFPKRAGGEDFYLLNKMAKVGAIRCLHEPDVRLESRLSSRAPFGTGPGVSRIHALGSPLEDLRLYAPRLFGFLRAWLNCMPALYQIAGDPTPWLLEKLRNHSSLERDLIAAWLRSFDVPAAVTHARRHGMSPHQFTRHMHVWFDAFRTLKTVHFLRDRGIASVPLAEALDAPFIPCSGASGPEAALATVRTECWKTTVQTGLLSP